MSGVYERDAMVFFYDGEASWLPGEHSQIITKPLDHLDMIRYSKLIQEKYDGSLSLQNGDRIVQRVWDGERFYYYLHKVVMYIKET